MRYINQIKTLTQMTMSESTGTQKIENSGEMYPIGIIYLRESHDVRNRTTIKKEKICTRQALFAQTKYFRTFGTHSRGKGSRVYSWRNRHPPFRSFESPMPKVRVTSAAAKFSVPIVRTSSRLTTPPPARPWRHLPSDGYPTEIRGPG